MLGRLPVNFSRARFGIASFAGSHLSSESKCRKCRTQIRASRASHRFLHLSRARLPERRREIAMATLKEMVDAKPNGKATASSGQCDAILYNAAWAKLTDVDFVVPQQPTRKPFRAAKHDLSFVSVMGFDNPSLRQDHRARHKRRRDPLPRVQFAVSRKLNL